MALYYFSNTPHATRADGSKINTAAHYQYICREGSYARMSGRKEDLVLSRSGNMPAWAENPHQFWRAAEINRQFNGRAYREIRLALQEELPLEDNVALVEEFLDQSGIKKSHAFSYAIHDKTAAFDENHRNIHVHIMFSEKTIEHDRPLGPDQYFKHYALDRQGRPCAGYRSDRYFNGKESTVIMRKLWADLVNTKFRKRGMDITITDKSLKVQHEEMVQQGRHEEALLLDRIPAPHLGPKYLNPKTMERIRSFEQEVEAQCNDPSCPEEVMDKTDSQETIAEQKMVMFATDKLVRRLINEIRRERERILREDLMEREARRAEVLDEMAAAELEVQPVTVTAADVYDTLMEKSTSFANTEQQLLNEYKALQKKVVPADKLQIIAIEAVVGKEYQNVSRQYQRIQEQIKSIEAVYRPLMIQYREFDKVRTEYQEMQRNQSALEQELAQLKEQKQEGAVQYQELQAKYARLQEDMKPIAERYQKLAEDDKRRQAIGDEYVVFLRKRKAVQPEMDRYNALIKEKWTEIEAVMQQYRDSNQDIAEKTKALYAQMKKAQKSKEFYQEKAAELEEHVPEDHLFYCSKLTGTVMRNSRINGIMPIKECPIVAYKNRAYAIIEKLDMNDGTKHVAAVMLGDTTKKGEAELYQLTIEKANGKQGFVITDVQKTDDTVRLYPLRNSQQRQAAPIGPASGMAKLARQHDFTDKLERIIDRATAPTNAQYHAWWRDEDPAVRKKKSKIKRVENELYSGWSL